MCERTAFFMSKWKKALIAMFGCALALGIFIGIEENLTKQEPIVLETVNDQVHPLAKLSK